MARPTTPTHTAAAPTAATAKAIAARAGGSRRAAGRAKAISPSAAATARYRAHRTLNTRVTAPLACSRFRIVITVV